jgi:hypothetical protein
MVRLLPDFGKDPTPALMLSARSSFSSMVSTTSTPKGVAYPSRMPIGSGNRFRGTYQNFYTGTTSAPTECATAYMVVGDTDDFYEDFSAYLNSGETLSTAVITSDDGITISRLPTLAIGTTLTAVSNAAFTYAISGVTYTKAAVPAGTAPVGVDAVGDVIVATKFGAVAFDIDTAGTITAVEATGQAAAEFTTAALAVAALPDAASTKFRMGYVTASMSDGTFTFGGDDLDDAEATVTYTDNNISGTRVIYTALAVTAGVQEVKIVATTSDSRIETRLKNFEIIEIDID